MSTVSNDPRFNKFPKWVHQEFTRLERRLAEAEVTIEEDRTPVTAESRIVVEPYGNLRARHLDSGVSIKYTLREEGDIYVGLIDHRVWSTETRRYVNTPGMKVMFCGLPTRCWAIAAHPVASNMLILTAGR